MGTFDGATVAVLVILGLTFVTMVWLVLPTLPPLPSAVILLIAVPTFSLVIVCRVVTRRFDRSDAEPSVLTRKSRNLYWIMAVTFAAYVILAVIAAVLQPDQDGPAGDPEIVAGHYYLNVHGDLLPITKAEYEHGLRIDDMSFLSLFTIFDLANLFAMARAGTIAAARNPRTSRR